LGQTSEHQNDELGLSWLIGLPSHMFVLKFDESALMQMSAHDIQLRGMIQQLLMHPMTGNHLVLAG